MASIKQSGVSPYQIIHILYQQINIEIIKTTTSTHLHRTYRNENRTHITKKKKTQRSTPENVEYTED